MSHRAPSVRSRVAATSAGLVVALSLVSVPATFAQEGPDATVQSFLDAIEAKDFAALPSYFCEEFASEASAFDLTTLAGTLPEGTDAQALLDAFILDAEVTNLEVVSQTDTEAVVALAGTISMDIDAAALAPFIEGLLAASGQDVTPDMVTMMTDLLASEFTAESTPIDDEITLVPGEAMPWLICDELSGTTEVSPAASGEPSLTDPMASPEASPAA